MPTLVEVTLKHGDKAGNVNPATLTHGTDNSVMPIEFPGFEEKRRVVAIVTDHPNESLVLVDQDPLRLQEGQHEIFTFNSEGKSQLILKVSRIRQENI